MRGRLLKDADALADYEILEMLLFLGIPRRDTKPLAKSLVNRFGSFAAALAAPAKPLAAAGLPERAIEAFALAAEAAAQLARPEPTARTTLDSWDALDRHLARHPAPPGLSALLVNNRNQLLATPALPNGEPARAMLREALDRHASAVILLRTTPGPASLTPADHALHERIRRAAEPLAVTVHDLVVHGSSGWVSLRQAAG